MSTEWQPERDAQALSRAVRETAERSQQRAEMQARVHGRAEQEGLDLSGQRLLADIVQANVDSLAATNDRIQSIERSRHRATAEAFVALYDALARQPDTVRTMATERLLDRHAVAYDQALQVIHGDGVE